MRPMDQCLREAMGRVSARKRHWRRDKPFESVAVLALEPPVVVLEDAGGGVVKDDVHEKALDLGDEEGEVGDAGGLEVVALEASVGVGGELLGVDADLEGNGALPCEAAEEGGGRRC